MSSYIDHLTQAYSTATFRRKLEYLSYNILPLMKSGPNQEVLEIGPGLGEFTQLCSDKKIHAIDLIDNDTGILKFLRKKYSIRNAFCTSNITNIDDKLKKYDLIIGVQVFEHIPPTQYTNVMNILWKHLKVGGQLIFVVPNGNNPLGLVERYGDLQHFNSFTTRSLRDLACMLPISSYAIEIRGYHIPLTNALNIFRGILQKILHAFLLCILIVNGGTYFTVLTPNITCVLTKKR
ncbi:MAG TPA: class I SAM-dependent methyltransferase [Patescibacteria group bacterium]|nr:class I SAM-dependent methyltransferase [Patescibacteria group bacterium]